MGSFLNCFAQREKPSKKLKAEDNKDIEAPQVTEQPGNPLDAKIIPGAVETQKSPEPLFEISAETAKDTESEQHDCLQQIKVLTERAEQMQAKLQEAENEIIEHRRTVNELRSARAMEDGMYVVGSPVFECAKDFKELRDNTLSNLLFDLTKDPDLQDQLLPQLSRIAFYDFWNILGDGLTVQERINLAKEIIADPSQASKVCSTAEQTVRRILQGEGENPMDRTELRDQLEKFYRDSAVLVAKMELCSPALAFLPRGQLPKKGTSINSITGQHYEYDFPQAFGYATVEAVELPGLVACDLKGTIFCKASLKCSFPNKK